MALKAIIRTGILAGAAALGACASTPADEPAWLAERTAGAPDTYPELRDVPRTTIATTDPTHWAQAQAEMATVAAAVRANPRGVWTAPEDPAAFAAEARAVLEASRAAHE